MSRRLRITLLASATVLVLLLASALVLVYVMLRPERFTQTLKAGARQAGLQLTLTAPAHPSLWPRPGVRLEGLQLYVSGQPYPLLIAESGRIVVPWRTLLGGTTAITKLQLDAPRLDLDQLQRALGNLPVGNGKGPPSLPRIDTGVTIRDGALIRNGQPTLEHIDLHTGALVPGQPFILDAEARNDGQQMRLLKLSFTPRRAKDGAIALDKLVLDGRSGQHAALHLAGQARWSGGARLQLELAGQWMTRKGDPYKIALTGKPTPGTPQEFHLEVDGKAGSADLRLSPSRLTAWWQQITGAYSPGPLPTPPLDGRVKAAELNLGDLHARDLELTSGDALPAPAASVAKPAAKPKGKPKGKRK